MGRGKRVIVVAHIRSLGRIFGCRDSGPCLQSLYGHLFGPGREICCRWDVVVFEMKLYVNFDEFRVTYSWCELYGVYGVYFCLLYFTWTC